MSTSKKTLYRLRKLKEWAQFAVAALLLGVVAPVAMADRTTTFFHTDGSGSVVAATNRSGRLLWRKEYDPYGKPIGLASINEKISYTGKEFDDATGLTYFGARYYDPEIGRFLSLDAAGIRVDHMVTFNRYMYANDNPYSFIDPDGKETIFVGGAGVDGAYIGNMVKNLSAAGIQNVRAASSSSASFGGTVPDAVLVPKWNQYLGANFYSAYRGRVHLSIPDGEQLNLVGYSHGSIVAAQTALALSAGGQQVDNLVLIGAPINKDLLNAVEGDRNIKSVHVINLTEHGDPIHAGMSDAEIVSALPTLVRQMAHGTGHFYYAPSTAEGDRRRADLAHDLKDKGLR